LFLKGRFINDAIAKGYDAGAVEAVTSVEFDDVNDCFKRVDSFMAIRNEDSFHVLASAFKRIRNITKDNRSIHTDSALFEKQAEENLYGVFVEISGKMRALIDQKEYLLALKIMLQMKEPVDTFFEEVMVMTEDMAVRQNRLNLLTAVGELILQIGDISKMQQA